MIIKIDVDNLTILLEKEVSVSELLSVIYELVDPDDDEYWTVMPLQKCEFSRS